MLQVINISTIHLNLKQEHLETRAKNQDVEVELTHVTEEFGT